MKGCRPSTSFWLDTGAAGKRGGCRWPARPLLPGVLRRRQLSVLDACIHTLSASECCGPPRAAGFTDLPGSSGDGVGRPRSSCGRTGVIDPPASGSMPPSGWPDVDASCLSRRHPFEVGEERRLRFRARFFAGRGEDCFSRCALFAAATALGLPGLGGGVSVKGALRERRRWASSASSLATATLALPGALRFRPFSRSRSDFMRGLFFTAPFTASRSVHLRNLFECVPVCLPRSLPADSLSSGRTPA